jgi:hypothetical protein
MYRTLIILSLVLASVYANEQHCDRYYTWSTGKCVIRHQYIRYLLTISLATWLLNFGTKCQKDNWYTRFFFYNVIVPIGVSAYIIRIGGGPISDDTFYTMVGFQFIGTMVLVANLFITWIRSFSRTTPPTTIQI